MLKMDLIPEDGLEKNRKKLLKFGVTTLCAIILVFGGIFYLFNFLTHSEQTKKIQLREEINHINQEIQDTGAQIADALLIQKQFDNLNRLINKRMYWTKVLQNLGKITSPDVFYTRFEGNIDSKKITLPVYTRNYQTLAKQLKAWDLEISRPEIAESLKNLGVKDFWDLESFSSNSVDILFKNILTYFGFSLNDSDLIQKLQAQPILIISSDQNLREDYVNQLRAKGLIISGTDEATGLNIVSEEHPRLALYYYNNLQNLNLELLKNLKDNNLATIVFSHHVLSMAEVNSATLKVSSSNAVVSFDAVLTFKEGAWR